MTEISNNIKNMDNNEIKEYICTIKKKQLKNMKKISYLKAYNSIIYMKIFLMDIRELEELGILKEKDSFSKYIEGFINSINKSFEEISQEELIKEIGKLKTSRQELQDLLSIIDGYIIELSYIDELVDECGIVLLSRRDYGHISYNKNVEDLISKINQTMIEAKKDYNLYIYIISEIISILPMRLAKENYYNIIKGSLIKNMEKDTNQAIENRINNYKKQFDGSIMDGYGTKFDYYFTEIQKLKREKLNDKTLEDLSYLINKITDLTKKLQRTKEFILSLILINNMNIIINLIEESPYDLEISQIYERWILILKDINGKESDKFCKLIENKIKSREKDLVGDTDELEGLRRELLNREDFDYNQIDKDLLYRKRIFAYYNNQEIIDDDLGLTEEKEVNCEYLEQSIDSLIQYINRSIYGMNSLERRVRMRKLLSTIELPFDGIEEFLNHIKYSLDPRIISKEEINFRIDHIIYLLNSVMTT